MSGENRTRRSYGTGSIITRNGVYYGKWRVGGRQVKRKLGRVRKPGTSDGLTKAQAESRMRELMGATKVVVAVDERLAFEQIAERYLTHLEVVRNRKPGTVAGYRIMVVRHLGPFFGGARIDRIDTDRITEYMAAKRRAGLATQTVRNHLTFAHGVFKFAVQRGLCPTNPVAMCDRPRSQGATKDPRHLSPEEVGALIRAVPNDTLGQTDRSLYRVATMAGLRQGELIALRWGDIDWAAEKIRVRRNFNQGEFTSLKSRSSYRAVPMADSLADALDLHFKQSKHQYTDDLVLCHPETGGPYDPSKMRKRFKRALAKAGLRDARFHDLRHTYGTQMAAVGAPLRDLQGWMGHEGYATTEIYAAFAPDESRGRHFAEQAFGSVGTNRGTSLRPTQTNSDHLEPLESREAA